MPSAMRLCRGDIAVQPAREREDDERLGDPDHAEDGDQPFEAQSGKHRPVDEHEADRRDQEKDQRRHVARQHRLGERGIGAASLAPVAVGDARRLARHADMGEGPPVAMPAARAFEPVEPPAFEARGNVHQATFSRNALTSATAASGTARVMSAATIISSPSSPYSPRFTTKKRFRYTVPSWDAARARLEKEAITAK